MLTISRGSGSQAEEAGNTWLLARVHGCPENDWNGFQLRDNCSFLYACIQQPYDLLFIISSSAPAQLWHTHLIRSSSGASLPSQRQFPSSPSSRKLWLSPGGCWWESGDGAAPVCSWCLSLCWWVMPSDGWCWVKRTVMGRQRSEKPLPRSGIRGEGSDSGKNTVVFFNCRAGTLSFSHVWMSARCFRNHYRSSETSGQNIIYIVFMSSVEDSLICLHLQRSANGPCLKQEDGLAVFSNESGHFP